MNRSIKKVINNSVFLNSDENKLFNKKLSTYIGTKYCVDVNNGTDALEIALQSLGIKHGHQVLTPAFSCVSSSFCISTVGAVPVFLDCDDDFNIDVDKIEDKITNKTRAIIVVHLYGYPCDMDAIMRIANKHKIHVIEDCAQAIGAEYNGKKVGTFGVLSCFSFHPSKNLSAFGNGGAILTNNDYLYDYIRMYSNLGCETKYHHEMKGRNSRLDSIQAAVLNLKIDKLDKNNDKRIKLAMIYDKKLKNLDIVLPINKHKHVYNYYVIRCNKRDELKKFLEKNGVEVNINYPKPIHKYKAYSEYNHLKLEKAEKFCDQILSLPMHQSLKVKDVHHICKLVQEFYKM